MQLWGRSTEQLRLVAYIVPAQGHSMDLKELARYLSKKLPAYMIPTTFISLDALPLTANGKVNRKGLPDPQEAILKQRTFVAPRTPTEELLASLWASLLGLEQVGSEDNFFEIGGHSLLAMQMQMQVQSVFGIEPPIKLLFEAPTLAEFASRFEHFQKSAQPLAPIPVVERRHALSLSFAQERLWFLDQLIPDSPLYNIPTSLRVDGILSVSALEYALTQLLQRHETLRSRFIIEGTQPVQVIDVPTAVQLPLLDLSLCDPTEQRTTVEQLTQAEARRPFNLETGPLWRMQLLRLAETQHILLLTMHHIISDGWSQDILLRELSICYDAHLTGKAPMLPTLPIQYADYTIWQRQRLSGSLLDIQLAYWRTQLAGIPALQLPTDHPRGPLQTYNGAVHIVPLSPDLSAQLNTLSSTHRVTVFMTFLAAFHVLLSRYSGQPDFSIGSPIAGRTRPEIEHLIGFFVNTLILRITSGNDPTFLELLNQVRQVCLEAYAHQDIPFERLVAELQTERDFSRPALAQVILAFQNTPLDLPTRGEITFTSLPVDTGTAKFDLELLIFRQENNFVGIFEYNRDLFDAETIQQLAGHWENLLTNLVASPQQRISEVSILPISERQQVLDRWSQRERYEAAYGLHELFQQQVERTPTAIALEFEGQSWAYRELNERANQLAHRLIRLGVKPETLVGLFLERTPAMVISILAVLKAGGAYLPLDPIYPPERVAFMLEDAGASILITQQTLLAQLSTQALDIVLVEEPFTDEPVTNPVSSVTTSNLAYVIYTSGSTGLPKGSMITHANVVQLFAATQQMFHFTEQDVWTLFHSYAFDFSVWEMWGALLYGGRVIVISTEMSRSTQAFYDLLIDRQVTVLNQTPSAFRQLMAVDQAASWAAVLTLRLVIFGGEALEPAMLRPWIDRYPLERMAMVNMYGITETTVHVTHCYLRPADILGDTRSQIGSPLPNLQLYVLNQHLEPMPVGVVGELYVGGSGLARGYLGRVALTAERFIPHPFSDEPGARLYRTGDLARYLHSGTFEYLGRSDQQVKVRGFQNRVGRN